MKWEQIDDYHQRASVLGGWIFKAYEDVIHDQGAYGRGMVGGWDFRVSICFVPDPEHSWIIDRPAESKPADGAAQPTTEPSAAQG